MPVPKPITYEDFKKEAEKKQKEEAKREQNMMNQFDEQKKILNAIKMREELKKDKEKKIQDKRLAETLKDTRRLHETSQKEVDEKSRKKEDFDKYEEVDLEKFINDLENDENKIKCIGPGCSIMGGKKNKTKKNRKNNKKSKRNRRR